MTDRRRWLAVLLLLGSLFASPAFSQEDNTLTWDHDGINLSGFYVYHQLDAGGYTRIFTIQDEALRSYLHADQPDGEHCYQVSAFSIQAIESGLSNEVCKTVPSQIPPPPPPGAPNAPTNLQVT